MVVQAGIHSTTSGYAPEEMKSHLAHFIMLVVFSGFATTAVILRFWARKIQNQVLALHDYLTLLGLIFALAATGINVYGCCYPIQRKKGDIPEVLGLQLMFLSPVLWVTAVTTIRAAIIFLYIQIFPTRSFLFACYAVLAMNILFGASAVIADCLICRPITYRWGPSMVGGSCGNQRSLDMFIAIMNSLQDVVVVILPMPIVWGLQIARSKKADLSCIFGIGIMICIITMYRVKVTSTIGDPATLHAQDAYCRIALLTSLEALLGIISACLPMLKPLYRKLRDSMSEGGTKTIKSFISGSIPATTRTSETQDSSSGKHCSNDYASTTEILWYEREVEGKCERQDA